MKKLIFLIFIIALVSCGGNQTKESKVEKLLTSKQWKPDISNYLQSFTGDSSKAGNEIKNLIETAAGTLVFTKDEANGNKYERKYGKGLLSTSIEGFWKLSGGGNILTLTEIDPITNKQTNKEEYEIVKLDGKQLILKDLKLQTKIIYLGQ